MSQDPVPVVSPQEVALAPAPAPPIPAAQTHVCMNCGAALVGAYCPACGQRHEPDVHTLGHFLGEAFESITHADSRLWRTLGYLLVKPGRLTREFLEGRRVRYLPPFRLYLVISLLFFLVAGIPGFLDAKVEVGETSPERIAGLNKAAAALEEQAKDNPAMAPVAANLREAVKKEQARIEALKAGGADAATVEKESGDDVSVGICEEFKAAKPGAGWGYTSMQGFCKKMEHTSGRELMVSIIHNIPRAMFVLLPLLALLMKLLYWRPKRYYVEHLLFLVHNHAFVFLAFTILVLATSLRLPGNVLGVIQTFTWLYIFWYLFRAMRVYYAQSRGLTFAKYVVMGLGYFSMSTLVLALTAIVSALTL